MILLNFTEIKCGCGVALHNENVQAETHYTEAAGLKSLYYAVCPGCRKRHYMGDNTEVLAFNDRIIESFPQGVQNYVENFTK